MTLTNLHTVIRPSVIWLALLSLYVLAGVPLVTFHGDETIQIYNTNDYVTAFIDRRPLDLVIDFEQPMSSYYLRIHGSSVARYTMGLAWHLAGYSQADLPARGWNWTINYAANLEQGLRPVDGLLVAARTAPTLFLVASIAVMFAIGRQFGVAYWASGLYAINPIILLNARRAIQEGPLIFFGLLTILCAIHISQKRGNGWWIGLVLAAGMTLVSKNSGLIYVASAFGWILVAELTHFNFRSLVGVGLRLVGVGLLAVVMLVALSPGLWGDPITGLQKMVEVRKEQMDIQTFSEGGPSPIVQRLTYVVTQPFLAPVEHSELRWERIGAIRAEIERYMASPLSGLQFGTVIGGLLTVLAGVGLVGMFWRRLGIPLRLALGLLVWLGVNMVVLVVNPVLWQRYYVALIPIMTLLSGLGARVVVQVVRGRGLNT